MRVRGLSPRELAYCGVFGATALLMPVAFHVLRLGHVFMPMYLPLMALACFVRPGPAASTALLVPLVSAALTGMPPLYPPVALGMSLELGVMAWLLAMARGYWPKLPVLVSLLATLLFGRLFYVAFMVGVAVVVELPPQFVAGLSLLSGWPGIVLMLVVIPTLLRLHRPTTAPVVSEAT